MNNIPEVEKKLLNIIENKQQCIIYGESCIGKSRLSIQLLKTYKYHKIDCITENGTIQDESLLKATCLSKSLLQNENKKCLFLDEIENVEYSKIISLVKCSIQWNVPLLMTGKNGSKVPNGVSKIYMYAKQKGFIQEQGFHKKDLYYGEGYITAKHIFHSLINTNSNTHKITITDEILNDANCFLITGFLFDEYYAFTKGNMKKCMKASELFSLTNILDTYKQKRQMYIFGYYNRTILLHRYIHLFQNRIHTYKLKHFFPKCIYKNKTIHFNKHKLLELNPCISPRIFSLDYLAILRENCSTLSNLDTNINLTHFTKRTTNIHPFLKNYIQQPTLHSVIKNIPKHKNTSQIDYCMYIFKKGKRKGQPCQKKALHLSQGIWVCSSHK